MPWYQLDDKAVENRAASLHAVYKQMDSHLLAFIHRIAENYEQMKADRDYWEQEALFATRGKKLQRRLHNALDATQDPEP